MLDTPAKVVSTKERGLIPTLAARGSNLVSPRTGLSRARKAAQVDTTRGQLLPREIPWVVSIECRLHRFVGCPCVLSQSWTLMGCAHLGARCPDTSWLLPFFFETWGPSVIDVWMELVGGGSSFEPCHSPAVCSFQLQHDMLWWCDFVANFESSWPGTLRTSALCTFCGKLADCTA